MTLTSKEDYENYLNALKYTYYNVTQFIMSLDDKIGNYQWLLFISYCDDNIKWDQYIGQTNDNLRKLKNIDNIIFDKNQLNKLLFKLQEQNMDKKATSFIKKYIDKNYSKRIRDLIVNISYEYMRTHNTLSDMNQEYNIAELSGSGQIDEYKSEIIDNNEDEQPRKKR